MAAKKENLYGPIKAFSYLTPDQSDAPGGVLRRDNSTKRSNPPASQNTQASNLNRNSLYPPERDSQPSHYYGSTSRLAPGDEPDHGYGLDSHSNSGFQSTPPSKRRSIAADERHPKSPDSHPTLFDNFILKGGPPSQSSQTAEEPPPSRSSAGDRDSRGGDRGSQRGRQALQDLFQEPPPQQKPVERNSKYSSQASSTLGLLSDQSSGGSMKEARSYDPSPARESASSNFINSSPDPVYQNYDRSMPRNREEYDRNGLGYSVQAPKKGKGEFFPQIGQAPIEEEPPAHHLPNVRPMTPNNDFSPRMKNSLSDSDDEKRGRKCLMVTVIVVVALVCLVIGFVAGWFASKMTNQSGTGKSSKFQRNALIKKFALSHRLNIFLVEQPSSAVLTKIGACRFKC